MATAFLSLMAGGVVVAQPSFSATNCTTVTTINRGETNCPQAPAPRCKQYGYRLGFIKYCKRY